MGALNRHLRLDPKHRADGRARIARDAANALAGGELGLDRRNLVCRFCLSARRQSVK